MLRMRTLWAKKTCFAWHNDADCYCNGSINTNPFKCALHFGAHIAVVIAERVVLKTAVFANSQTAFFDDF